MRYSEILRECAEQRSGRRQQISMACAKAIAWVFNDDSELALTFAETGEIVGPYEQLWEKFFPKRQRSDAENTVSLALYDYLYRRRNHKEAPASWQRSK